MDEQADGSKCDFEQNTPDAHMAYCVCDRGCHRAPVRRYDTPRCDAALQLAIGLHRHLWGGRVRADILPIAGGRVGEHFSFENAAWAFGDHVDHPAKRR